MTLFFQTRGCGEGRAASSRASSARCVCRDSRSKSLFWPRRGDVFQTGLLPQRGKKVPREPGFSGKEGRILETGLHKPPRFKFLWPENSACRIQLLSARAPAYPEPGAFLIFLLIFTSTLWAPCCFWVIIFLFYQKGNLSLKRGRFTYP